MMAIRKKKDEAGGKNIYYSSLFFSFFFKLLVLIISLMKGKNKDRKATLNARLDLRGSNLCRENIVSPLFHPLRCRMTI